MKKRITKIIVYTISSLVLLAGISVELCLRDSRAEACYNMVKFIKGSEDSVKFWEECYSEDLLDDIRHTDYSNNSRPKISEKTKLSEKALDSARDALEYEKRLHFRMCKKDFLALITLFKYHILNLHEEN